MKAILIQPKTQMHFQLLANLADALKIKYEPIVLPKKKRKSGLELSWEDVEAGRITHCKDFDDFCQKLGL